MKSEEIKKLNKTTKTYNDLKKVEVIKQIDSCRLSMNVDDGGTSIKVRIQFMFYGHIITYFEAMDNKQNFIDQYDNVLIEEDFIYFTFDGEDKEIDDGENKETGKKFYIAACVLNKMDNHGKEIEGQAVDYFVYALSRFSKNRKLNELVDRYRYLKRRIVE